ncbi:unnamed protein product [Symbiodinium sp. CCMP2592]|nr:unnamed protein product [Symbiodinium sp. CCMP2592]
MPAAPRQAGGRRPKNAVRTGSIHDVSAADSRCGMEDNARTPPEPATSTMRPAAASRCGVDDARTPLAPAASAMGPAAASRCGVDDARTPLAPAASTMGPAAASRCGMDDARTPLAPAASTMSPAAASHCGVEDDARTLLAPAASPIRPATSYLCWAKGLCDHTASSCISLATCGILARQDNGCQDATRTGTGSKHIAPA